MRIYILYGFGTLLCVAGVGFLAAEYIKYLSEFGKLACLVLTTAMFTFFGKHFDERGW